MVVVDTVLTMLRWGALPSDRLEVGLRPGSGGWWDRCFGRRELLCGDRWACSWHSSWIHVVLPCQHYVRCWVWGRWSLLCEHWDSWHGYLLQRHSYQRQATTKCSQVCDNPSLGRLSTFCFFSLPQLASCCRVDHSCEWMRFRLLGSVLERGYWWTRQLLH